MFNSAHHSTTDFIILEKNPKQLCSLCKPQCFPNIAELNHLAKQFPDLMDTESEAQEC